MAVYEYLCKDCGTTFEQQRAMADAEGEVRCPSGHDQVRRRFSVYAMSASGPGAPAPASMPSGAGGGCCGGGCGCR